MSEKYTKYSSRAGLAPGSIQYMGTRPDVVPEITIFHYDKNNFEEKQKCTIADIEALDLSKGMHWINIDGIHDDEMIEQIGRIFNLHHLVLENIIQTGQRPKIEDYDNYIFFLIKMLYFAPTGGFIEEEQVSIILGKNFAISFQEKPGDVFEVIRERIRDSKYRIRKQGSDYLAYSLLDSIVDNYFFILETLGDNIEIAEKEVFSKADSGTIKDIYSMKRKMIMIRKSIWPLREVVSSFIRSESILIDKLNYRFLNDLYDHIILLIDTIESFRDMVSGLLDIYLSSVSNKTNDVMKVLTIIATIFMPLTFIGGVYGMNFKNMPELYWPWAYFAVLGLMGVITIGMIIFFKRKKWL
ncbi:magnesium/cobalt transporter CorA [Candidatus Cloacimonadota bacterium]